ncbi:F-box protein At5g65850-like isoform X1 [Coffea eugenioides]|uniref:F-box protein At5g65850-like isoform X1 n=2 Tax=Coffea eugenioides TaxID=49369 RepID=UPI000F611A3E|nr:F-box protein At5g65850-like isoform X1 [Coffea eugenioides]
MMAKGVDHMLKRYNLRPRPTRKKVEYIVSYCFSKSKRHTLYPHANDQKIRRRPSIPYLPPEIIFNILVYLPADILYNVMRYVCREWYNIISSPTFIDAHLLKVDRGMLIKQIYPDCNIHYVEMVKNDLPEIIEVDSSHLPTFGMSSCNGLVLMAKSQGGNRYVANLVTKEVVTLPPPSAADRANPSFSGMGHTCSKKYKLVEFYINDQRKLEGGILTLGVDREWRCLCRQNETREIDKFGFFNLFYNKPIASAEGILHWTHYKFPLVLNLDLETETFYTRATPKCAERKRRTYMGTGQSLCFMDYLGKFSWELWLLKDAEAGEWTKLAIIDLGPQEQMLRHTLCPAGFQIVPVGFLKDGEIAVLYVAHEDGIQHERCYHHKSHPSRNCITYNMKTGVINSFHLDKGKTCEMNESWRYIPHVKSLVSLKFSAN